MSTTHAALAALAIAELGRRDPRLLPDGARADDWLGRAVADDSVKRRVLRHALRTGGPEPLLAIGLALPRMTYLPALHVLLDSADTTVLAEKWMRLEGYYHSSHRTTIDAGAPGAWRCHHHAVHGAPPILAEHLLIAGVLNGLLRAFGLHGVRLERPPTHSGRWTLRWQGRVAPEAAPPGLERWLPGDHLDARIAQLVAADPARSWTLATAARALGCSARSLQRHLAAGGNRFATLLRASRVAAAASLLRDGDASLADVGYACGFADQAHFQRSFRAVVGMTPADFRRR